MHFRAVAGGSASGLEKPKETIERGRGEPTRDRAKTETSEVWETHAADVGWLRVASIRASSMLSKRGVV